LKYLLDTCAISEFTKLEANTGVIEWMKRRWCMNKVICNQCVTQFICDVFSKKRLFLIKNHQSNKYNPLIYLYFIHAPTPDEKCKF
jgi:predicted nucleic acid-binding protein